MKRDAVKVSLEIIDHEISRLKESQANGVLVDLSRLRTLIDLRKAVITDDLDSFTGSQGKEDIDLTEDDLVEIFNFAKSKKDKRLVGNAKKKKTSAKKNKVS